MKIICSENSFFLKFTFSTFFAKIVFFSKLTFPQNSFFSNITFSQNSHFPSKFTLFLNLQKITFSLDFTFTPRNNIYPDITFSQKLDFPKNHIFPYITFFSKITFCLICFCRLFCFLKMRLSKWFSNTLWCLGHNVKKRRSGHSISGGRKR